MEGWKKKRSAKGKVVVITGASAGVGRATAREFGKKGACVALIARGENGLEAARHEIAHAGGEAISIAADMSDFEAVERAAQAVENRFGKIDTWINNAMTSVFAPVWEIEPEEFKRATEVTYLGYVYGTLAALKRMRTQGFGTIIQVGSALAYRSIPLQSAYCAAKHAIVGFTDSLRSELIHDKSKIRLSMVHLPAMNTPQFSWVLNRLENEAQPVPPIFQPEVAARAIVHAAFHHRREWFIGLPTLKAVIGQKFIPGYLDRMLATGGYDGQQTDEPRDPNRPNNLWDPIDEDRGARGNFDSRAADSSPMFWFSKNRNRLAAAAATALTAAAVLLLGKMRQKSPSKEFSSFASGVPRHPHEPEAVTRLR